MEVPITIQKIYSDVEVPTYAHTGDVGLDLRARENYVIEPGTIARFDLGFALAFPEGYAAIVMDKSGRAAAGLKTIGGVFDAGYRGEYNVQLLNVGSKSYTVEVNDKIAQLVIVPVAFAQFTEADELPDSERGTGRFGSTGKQ